MILVRIEILTTRVSSLSILSSLYQRSDRFIRIRLVNAENKISEVKRQ